MFKNINKILLAGVLSLLLLSSCNNFDDLNTNPTKSPVIDPNNQLAYAQLLTGGDWLTMEPYNFYFSSFVQHVQGEWNVTNYGGQYRRSNPIMSQTWTRIYGLSMKNLVDVIDKTKDDPSYTNVRSIARIFRVYYSMILTDMYGDIPYFEAGRGASQDISSPVYNKQEVIYDDFLKEMKEVEAALSAAGGTVTGDIIYSGDITKWKRFANSLRLRAAMRLTKVNPEKARKEVIEILGLASGLLTINDDALTTYNDIFDWETTEIRRNAMSQIWRGRDPYPTQCICSTLWNYLKDTSDPRLLKIGRSYDETALASGNPFNRIDLTDEIITTKGLSQFQPPNPGYFWYDKWPSGYWSTSTQKWQDKSCRPQLNNAFLKGDAPGVLMTYAEVQLLLSEAKVRWSGDIPSSTTAKQYYENGVTAAMKLLAKYKINAISDAEISTYLTTNPYPATVNGQMKSINEQLWILHLTNGPEAFANWRRSGYPVLKSSHEYGAITIESQTIPRRLNYPLSEASYNKEAYNAALEAMGGVDSWNARVWWDKQ